MSKLGQVLGKFQADVDKIMSKVKLNPDDFCTDDMTDKIGKILEQMRDLMKLIPILRQIIKIIKLIQKVMKLVQKVLKWATLPIPVVAVVEKLLELLSIMGMVDMLISVLLKTVGRFTTIIPLLQAQLMSILAMCAAQAGQPPPDNKEDCEAAGGTWIDPDDLKDLQDMYDKLSDEMSGVDDEVFGFCSIPEYDNKADCEANGGTWTDLDVNTNFDAVDTSTLTSELALQLDELSKCFADPNLKEYLEGL
jgi:hypothetical protein